MRLIFSTKIFALVTALLVAPLVAGEESLPWGDDEFYIYVNKEENSLSLRSIEVPGKTLKVYRAISGLNAGDKVYEGDRRTPEGIYITTRRVRESELYRPLHGPAGIELNYPNPVDRINRQTGSGIWIHGVEGNERLAKRFDTRGCVAVSNEDILELVNFFVPDQTVVVIVDRDQKKNPWGLQTVGNSLEKKVRDWARAWSSQITDDYLAFYHSEFTSRNMDYAQWRVYKNSLNRRYTYINVDVNSIRTFKHSKYWMTQFEQVYESNLFRSKTLKRLYWVGAANNPKIISEKTLNTVEGPKNVGPAVVTSSNSINRVSDMKTSN